MGISSLMNKLHHKDEPKAPMPVPKPPSPPSPPAEEKEHKADPQPEPVRAEERAKPVKRWGAREVSHMTIRDDEGIILDIGENMSINIPIKRRMSLEDFLKVAERVKRIEELNMGQPSYNEHMGEYH